MICLFSPNTGIPVSSLAYTKLNLQLYMTSKTPGGGNTSVWGLSHPREYASLLFTLQEEI